MKAADWIDRLKAAQGWESDYRVAKEIGVGRAAVSRYRNNPECTMDEEVAIKVAAFLNLDPGFVLLDQVAERTRSEAVRVAVQQALARMTGGTIGGGSSATGGKGRRVDITSVTAAAADPERTTGGRARPEYASYPLTKPAPVKGRRRARLKQAAARLIASLTPAPFAPA